MDNNQDLDADLIIFNDV